MLLAVSEPAAISQQDRRRQLTQFGLRLAGCAFSAGIATAPLAAAYALRSTEIHDTVGELPTTLSFTHNGYSSAHSTVVNIYKKKTKLGIGMDARVDGLPPNATIADLATPDTIRTYAGLIGDPKKAIKAAENQLVGALEDNTLKYTGLLGGIGTVAALVGGEVIYMSHGKRLPRKAVSLLAATTSVASLGTAAYLVHDWGSHDYTPTALHTIYRPDGTIVKGLQTDNQLAVTGIEHAREFYTRIQKRQEAQDKEFTVKSDAGIQSRLNRLEAPRQGESVVYLQSDMHSSSIGMHELRKIVAYDSQKYRGAVKLMIIDGDLTYASGFEGSAIKEQIKIGTDNHLDVAGVDGNHGTALNTKQEKAAGMDVLDDQTHTFKGISVGGEADPLETPFFGPDKLRGTETEQDAGLKARELVSETHPDFIALHEPAAAEALLGIDDLKQFMDQHDDYRIWKNDNVRNLKTGAIIVGHTHEYMPPRVAYNPDGSWTVVFHLGTSGGAIPNPTLGHISLPFAVPLRTMTNVRAFVNNTSGLVTGYQLLSVDTEANVQFDRRIDIGSPDGQPFPVGVNQAKDHTAKNQPRTEAASERPDDHRLPRLQVIRHRPDNGSAAH